MAFYAEEKEEEPGVVPETTGPKGSSVISGGATGATPIGGAKPAAAGNNFVGIKQYVDANKAQSSKLANNVGNYVTGLGDTARSSINEGSQKFGQDVNANTVNLNQGLVNEAKTKAQNVTADQNKLNEFQKMRDANYQGPTDFSTSQYYQPVQQNVAKAQTASKNTENEQGQRDLIGQLQKDNYGAINKGAQTFSSVLLGSDPNARTILGQAREKNADIPQVLNTATANANQLAGQGAATTANTKKVIDDTFKGTATQVGVQKQLENDITGRIAGAMGADKAEATKIMDALKTGATAMTPQQLGMMGVTEAQWNDFIAKENQLKGNVVPALNTGRTLENFNNQNVTANLGQFGSVGEANNIGYNAANVANAEEYARYQALNDLMSTNNTFLNQANASQAGTKGSGGTDPLAFDLGKAQEDQARRQQLRQGDIDRNTQLNTIRGNLDQTVASVQDKLRQAAELEKARPDYNSEAARLSTMERQTQAYNLKKQAELEYKKATDLARSYDSITKNANSYVNQGDTTSGLAVMAQRLGPDQGANSNYYNNNTLFDYASNSYGNIGPAALNFFMPK